MKKILFSFFSSLLITSATFAGVSLDWVRDGNATGSWSTIDKNDNVFVTSWDGSIWLRKFDKFGNFQWEVNYTTPLLFNYLYPSRVHADSLGNAVVVGYRYTSPTEGRNANALVILKYGPTGTLIWEKIIEGSFSPWNNSLFRTNVSSVMDAFGNVFVGTAGNVSGYPTTGFNAIKITPTGTTAWVSTKNISGFPYHFVSNIRLNGNKIVLAGHTDYWLANAAVWVLGTNGVSKWAKTEIGIGGADAIIDNTGKVFLLTSSFPGYDSDISIYRYKSNGAFMWHNLYDMGGADIGYRMELTPDNKIALHCYGNQTGISLYVDWLTSKMTLNGAIVWTKRYDAHSGNDEIPYNMAVDADGDIFVTGIGGPFPGGFNLGARQFVTVKYKSNGTQAWVYAVDTINEYQSGRHINIDSHGNLFVLMDINSIMYHLLDNTGADPCSVPTGVAVSDITETSAIISWEPVINAYLYHVQYKTTASPIWYTLVTDATSITLNGLLTGATYDYHVEAVCNSGPTGYSPINNFTALGTTYCTAGGLNAANDWIDLVYVADLLNSTIESAGGYNDFTYLTATMKQGVTYSFTLSAAIVGGSYFEYWNVWIDFNGDGDFTDAGENIVSYNSDQIGWESHSFTVPLTAVTGNTLMRVSMKRGSAPTSCETFSKGETEDYTVSIIPAKMGNETTTGKNKILVYPNPANDMIHIQSELNLQNGEIMILDMNGQQINHATFNGNQIQINIESLPSGIYFVIITDESGYRSTAKFIKN